VLQAGIIALTVKGLQAALGLVFSAIARKVVEESSRIFASASLSAGSRSVSASLFIEELVPQGTRFSDGLRILAIR